MTCVLDGYVSNTYMKLRYLTMSSKPHLCWLVMLTCHHMLHSQPSTLTPTTSYAPRCHHQCSAAITIQPNHCKRDTTTFVIVCDPSPYIFDTSRHHSSHHHCCTFIATQPNQCTFDTTTFVIAYDTPSPYNHCTCTCRRKEKKKWSLWIKKQISCFLDPFILHSKTFIASLRSKSLVFLT